MTDPFRGPFPQEVSKQNDQMLGRPPILTPILTPILRSSVKQVFDSVARLASA